MNKVLERLKEEYNETLNRMQDLGDILAHCAEMDTSHCGQDAEEDQAIPRLRHDVLGKEVICVGGSKTRCVGCPQETDSCLKVELVGGTYLCLDKPQQEDAKPVISFDKEKNEDIIGDIMAEIKEKADDFMDYLDSVTNPARQ